MGSYFLGFSFAFFLVVSVSHAGDVKTIAVLGDSLTEGYGLAKDSAFPHLLEKKLQRDFPSIVVINAGVSGSTSAGGASRLDWILKSKPQVLIVALGANDGLRGIPTHQTKENLSRIIKSAQEKKVKVLLLGMRMPPNYGAKFTKNFEKMFGEVAKDHGVPLYPFLLDGVAGQPKLNLPDGIHPNENGHKVLADKLYPFVKSNL